VTFAQELLRPFAALYSAAARLRATAYRAGLVRRRSIDAAAVVSVGNLTVGGTGKTPMVLWIAEHLIAEGQQVGILTRGYRGATRSKAGADRHAAQSTSDEVQLLQARLGPQVTFGVGADRFRNGVVLAKQGARWLILDDGFQHLQLARTVDIVLLDATDPFGGGQMLPAGRLREPRSALARADLIVITRTDHAPALETIVRRYSAAPIFYARPELSAVRVFRGRYPGDRDTAAHSRKLFAFCGIGNPNAFLADLRNWAFDFVGHKFFPDHHRYSQREIDEIWREAAQAGAQALMCTEKDIFNLAGVPGESLDLLYCQISMQVAKPEGLWNAIKSMARSGKPIRN
jgi:tetraacyldisaccharide 4'-kinase